MFQKKNGYEEVCRFQKMLFLKIMDSVVNDTDIKSETTKKIVTAKVKEQY